MVEPEGVTRGGGLEARGRNFLPDIPPFEGDGEPRPFNPADMDVRGTSEGSMTSLYDPAVRDYSEELDRTANTPKPGPRLRSVIQAASFQQLLPKEEPKADPKDPVLPKLDPKDEPMPKDTVRAPRGNVTVESLEELGVLILGAQNQADLDEVIRLLDFIIKNTPNTEAQLQLVPLQHGDAIVVAGLLNQVYSRINLLPSGPVIAAGVNPRPGQQQQQQGNFFGGGIGQGATGSQATGLLLHPRASLQLHPRRGGQVAIRGRGQGDQTPRPANGQGRAAELFSTEKGFSADRRSTVAGVLFDALPRRVAERRRRRRRPRASQQPTNLVRISFDVSTNTIIVQASPADLEEIRGIIERIDSTRSRSADERVAGH